MDALMRMRCLLGSVDPTISFNASSSSQSRMVAGDIMGNWRAGVVISPDHSLCKSRWMKITLNRGCYRTELWPDNLTDKSLLKVYFFNILNPLRCKIKLVTIYNNHQNKILCLLLTKVHGNSPKDYQTLKTCIVVITINLMMRSKITGFKYNLRA